MNRLIEELYYANIDIAAEQKVKRLTLEQAAAVVDQWEGVLFQRLSGSGVKSIVQGYANAYAEYASILSMESFCRGFRLGANFMQSINKDGEGALREEK